MSVVFFSFFLSLASSVACKYNNIFAIVYVAGSMHKILEFNHILFIYMKKWSVFFISSPQCIKDLPEVCR